MGQQGEVEGGTPVLLTGSGGTWRWSHQIDPAGTQPEPEFGLDPKLLGGETPPAPELSPLPGAMLLVSPGHIEGPPDSLGAAPSALPGLGFSKLKSVVSSGLRGKKAARRNLGTSSRGHGLGLNSFPDASGQNLASLPGGCCSVSQHGFVFG